MLRRTPKAIKLWYFKNKFLDACRQAEEKSKRQKGRKIIQPSRSLLALSHRDMDYLIRFIQACRELLTKTDWEEIKREQKEDK